MISLNESKKYLQVIHDLNGFYSFYDVHTHPFEIIFSEHKYKQRETSHHLYSAGLTCFPFPKITEFMIGLNNKNKRVAELFHTSEILKKKISNQYFHTGPFVFEKNMNISGIGRVLLLPVASTEKSVEAQMLEMEKMFGSDNKFLFGWSVSNSISNDKIYLNAKNAKARFNIKAIKLHPNITEIDPKSKSGKSRIEIILETCSKLKLPLIVHGGKSRILRNMEASSYSTLKNLACINWDISSSPVIIAHGGFFGYNYEKIDSRDLEILKNLLSKYHNVLIDLSGLNVQTILLLLKNVDSNKILFGSDMLYETQWQMVVKTLFAIDKKTKRLEETFIKFSYDNPAKCFA